MTASAHAHSTRSVELSCPSPSRDANCCWFPPRAMLWTRPVGVNGVALVTSADRPASPPASTARSSTESVMICVCKSPHRQAINLSGRLRNARKWLPQQKWSV